jgi:hypothetical protein
VTDIDRSNSKVRALVAGRPKGGSRKDGPLLEGPPEPEQAEARAMIRWLLEEGLATRDKHGNTRLRSRGKAVLMSLTIIDGQDEAAYLTQSLREKITGRLADNPSDAELLAIHNTLTKAAQTIIGLLTTTKRLRDERSRP